MRNILKFLAVLALAGGLTACNKDKGPEGPTDFSGGCEAVDLGLGVKWASYNVGALNVDGRGSYFAWGETCEKSNYDWSDEGDYKWGVYDNSASPKFGMTKYTADVEGGDGLKTLQPGDDPATANYGNDIRTGSAITFGRSIPSGAMDISYALSAKHLPKRSANTSRIKGNFQYIPTLVVRNG